MLRDRGLVLNHAIARRAKANKRQVKKIRPETEIHSEIHFPWVGTDPGRNDHRHP